MLFPFHYFLDFIQLVQGFQRSEIIHIEIQDFITHLAKHRVVQLEKAELHTVAIRGNFGRWLGRYTLLAIVSLQLVQNGVSALYNAFRHTCQFRYMDTERVLTSSPFKFTEEDDLVIHFLHRYIVILDALEGLLHLVQLVIVGGKKGAGLRLGMLVDMLHNAPVSSTQTSKRALSVPK